MGIYLVIFFFLMIVALKENQQVVRLQLTKKHSFRTDRDLFLFVFSVSIIVIAGIRWRIGTDWDSFLTDFRFFKKVSWAVIQNDIYGLTYGSGYVYVTYFFAKYVGNYSVYLAFQAFFIVVCVYPIIVRYSKYPVLSFLGLFAFSFGYAFAVPRSGFAMAICFRAFDALLRNKKLLFILLVLLATLFHNTAIIFLAIFFFDKIKLSIPWVIIIGIVSCVISIFAKSFLLKIATLSFVPLSYSVRIFEYVLGHVDYGGVSNWIRILTRGFVLVLIFLFLWNKRSDRRVNLLVNMYLVSTAIYIAVSKLSEVLMRLSYYYEDVSQFIIFAECVASCKIKSNRLVLCVILMMFFVGKMMSRLIGNHLIVPFKTIF